MKISGGEARPQHQGVQLRLGGRLLRLGPMQHLLQPGENLGDLAAGALYLLLGLTDLVHHRPIGKEAVEEKVRKAEEAVDADVEIRLNIPHIHQLRPEAPQLHLQLLHRRLGIVQMIVLGKVGNEAASEEVPGGPAVGTVQALEDPVCRGQGLLSGADSLPDLFFLALQAGDPLLQAQNLPGGGLPDSFRASCLRRSVSW